MVKMNLDVSLLRCDDDLISFENNGISKTLNDNLNEHIVQITKEMEITN